jgi:hypothetical protein
MDRDAHGHSLILKIWYIKRGQKRDLGLWCLIPCSLEILVLRDYSPSRVLVYVMALSGKIISSSKLIH